MRAEMEKLEWMEKPVPRIQEFLGVNHVPKHSAMRFSHALPGNGPLCAPSDALPEGFVNVRTGETHPEEYNLVARKIRSIGPGPQVFHRKGF